MKILLVTGDFLPGKNGGIENYTNWLATILLLQQFEVQMAVLNVKEKEDYYYNNIKVNNLNGNLSYFENLLKSGEYDVCHFHEYSEYGGIEIPWFKAAKENCKKVFFTFHLPYLTCYKGDFRYNGLEDCSNFSDPSRCANCIIADKINYTHTPFSELYFLSAKMILSLTGKRKSLKEKIIDKYQKLNELVEVCDNLFIYANWFKLILAHNGFNSPKIKKIPYKLKSETSHSFRDGVIKYKILFVGRIQAQKGLHLLCEAMNNLNVQNISLDVYGNIVDQNYFEKCTQEYNFNFKGTTEYFQLLKELRNYDFLILPSVFTEMFSLIIKDAFYERLPVIASSAKGNADAIKDGINGFLFEYNSSKDLALTVDRAYSEKLAGWEPQFESSNSPDKDLEEIVSYYCL